MRWRWPFRLGREPIAPTADEPAAPGRGRPLPPAPDEWRHADPMAGLASAPDLTIDGASFSGETAAGRALRPVLRPVHADHGLDRSVAAPSVRLRGSGRSTAADSPIDELPLALPADDGDASTQVEAGRVDAAPSATGRTRAASPARSAASATSARPARPATPTPSTVAAGSVRQARPASERPEAPLTVVPRAQRTVIETTMTPEHGRLDLAAHAAPAPAVRHRWSDEAPELGGPPPVERVERVDRLDPPAREDVTPPATAVPTASDPPPMVGPRRRRVERLGLGEPVAIAPPSRPLASARAEAADALESPDPATARPALELPPTGPTPEPGGPVAVAGGDTAVIRPRPSGPAPAPAPAPASAPIAGLAPVSAMAPPIRQRRPVALRDGADEATPALTPATPPLAIGDVSADVDIDRSEEGARAAKGMDALAFTSGTTVVLPPEHGPLDEPPAQALLAHEMVHVVQQQRFGSDLPAEDSPAGEALEQEARAAEVDAGRAPGPPLALAGVTPMTSGADADVATLPLARGRATGEAMAAGRGRDDAAPGEAIGEAAPPRAARRAAIDLPVAAPTAFARSGEATAPVEADEPAGHLATMEAHAPQRAAADAADVTADAGGSDEGEGEDAELEELARKLYDRLAYRLRRELLLDRERSGLLIDIG